MNVIFYFDEDAAEHALVQALRSRGLRVLVPHEVGLLGADDLDQLRWCAKEKCVLVSHNASDFCRYHREFLKHGESHAEVIIVHLESVGRKLGSMIRHYESFCNHP